MVLKQKRHMVFSGVTDEGCHFKEHSAPPFTCIEDTILENTLSSFCQHALPHMCVQGHASVGGERWASEGHPAWPHVRTQNWEWSHTVRGGPTLIPEVLESPVFWRYMSGHPIMYRLTFDELELTGRESRSDSIYWYYGEKKRLLAL